MSEWLFLLLFTTAIVIPVAIAVITTIQMRVTHNLVNSRMDELLALTKKSSHAEGVLEGKSVSVANGGD